MNSKYSMLEKHPRLVYVPFVSAAFLGGIAGFSGKITEPPFYMLTALVHSEAIFLATVAIASVVAVQLAAFSYSSQMIKLFKKFLDFWGLLGVYLGTMGITLYILEKLETASEIDAFLVRMCFFLGIICFSILIPYTYVLLTMLTPSTLVKTYAERIDRKSITETDPVQPVMDIVQGALMKYDYETARVGIQIVGEKVCSILEQRKYDQDSRREKSENEKGKKDRRKEMELKKLSKRVYDHFSRIGRLAAARNDEYSVLETIKTVELMRDIAFERDMEEIKAMVVALVRGIGRAALENGMEEPVREIIRLFETNARKLIEKKHIPEAAITVGYIDEMGKGGISRSFVSVLQQEIVSLERIGTLAKKENLGIVMTVTENLLKTLMDAARERNLQEAQWCSAILQDLLN